MGLLSTLLCHLRLCQHLFSVISENKNTAQMITALLKIICDKIWSWIYAISNYHSQMILGKATMINKGGGNSN